MKKEKLHDELNEHAPFLNELRQKEDGLRVPGEYFDALEDSVFRQLDAIGARRKPAAFAKTKQQRSWWQFSQYLWQPRLALAVAGLLVMVVVGWRYFIAPPAAPVIADATISAEDAATYLLDNLQEFDLNQIAMILPEDEFPQISLDPGHGTTPEGAAAPKNEVQISPEDLEQLLRDMTDEELEELL